MLVFIIKSGCQLMNIVDFRFVFLPYCLQKQPNGGYVVLNRKYKPVGFVTDKYITYSDYPVIASIDDITPELASKLSWNNSRDVDTIYLYHDESNPVNSADNMKAYTDKLALLSVLPVLF